MSNTNRSFSEEDIIDQAIHEILSGNSIVETKTLLSRQFSKMSRKKLHSLVDVAYSDAMFYKNDMDNLYSYDMDNLYSYSNTK